MKVGVRKLQRAIRNHGIYYISCPSHSYTRVYIYIYLFIYFCHILVYLLSYIGISTILEIRHVNNNASRVGFSDYLGLVVTTAQAKKTHHLW